MQILFMAGFLIGMILPDIAWKMEWHQKTISAMYLLRSFAAGSEAGVEYFLQVLGMRGSVYLLGQPVESLFLEYRLLSQAVCILELK